MKRWLPTFILITAVLAAYPFLFRDDSRPAQHVTGLPWQIDMLDDGSTRVFGIVPGSSTLQQAVDVLGDDYELAVISQAGDRDDSLELYYSGYRAGLLGGKMVLVAAADDGRLNRWRERAVEQAALKSGARKFTLSMEDRFDALGATVDGITFIPSVNLDDEVIRARFGEPSRVVQKETGAQHYLYPEAGLDILLDENGREVLQYVAPADFSRLVQPLDVLQ